MSSLKIAPTTYNLDGNIGVTIYSMLNQLVFSFELIVVKKSKIGLKICLMFSLAPYCNGSLNTTRNMLFVGTPLLTYVEQGNCGVESKISPINGALDYSH